MIYLLWLRHEFWWHCEKFAGWLWRRYSKDRATYWLDWLPAFFISRRYRAQNAMNRRGYTVYLRKIAQ